MANHCALTFGLSVVVFIFFIFLQSVRVCFVLKSGNNIGKTTPALPAVVAGAGQASNNSPVPHLRRPV